MAGKTEYRGYRIDFWQKPGPCRGMDYGFSHKDYDGAPDSGDGRWGYASSLEEAHEKIDDLIDEFGDDENVHIVALYLPGISLDGYNGLVKQLDLGPTEGKNLIEALRNVKLHVNVASGEIVAVDDCTLTEEPFDEDEYRASI